MIEPTLSVYQLQQFEPRLVGHIKTDINILRQFTYDNSYLNAQDARPLSLAMPLRSKPYGDVETERCFEALLPEESARQVIMRALHIRNEDYLPILEAIGYECVGDVIIAAEDTVFEEDNGYEQLSESDLMQLAQSSPEQIAQLQIQSRLSLAGAQMKVGLYHDRAAPPDKGWYMPSGFAASTHIVKVPHIMEYLLLNECLVIRAARQCAIKVADVALVGTEYPLLAIERFDRIMGGANPLVNGLPAPLRIHQEDFAQALKVSGKQKYESRISPEGYVAQMGKLLALHSSDILSDLTHFARLTLFNFAIGNCDNHLKNHSLIAGQGFGMHLAPAYDLISTTVLGFSREMGLALGGEIDCDRVTTSNLMQFADELGISREIVRRISHQIALNLEAAFVSSADAISINEGHTYAPTLARKILADATPRLKVLTQL